MALVNTRTDIYAPALTYVVHTPATPTASPTRPAFFRWREQWNVGIEALDRDHRALASILNHIAVRFGTPAADANARSQVALQRHQHAPCAMRYWLDALRSRTREHFAREESLMRATHYPNAAEHTGEHALMLAEYTAMVREIIDRDEKRLLLADLEALKHWFMGHMLDMDKRLGNYLRENGISALHPRH